MMEKRKNKWEKICDAERSQMKRERERERERESVAQTFRSI